MQAVDTSAAVNYDQNGNDSAFLPAANFTFTQATKIINVVEAGALPAGHALAGMIIDVYDKKGNMKSGRIAAAAGNVNIDLDAATALDLTGPVDIKVTVVTDKGFSKTGYYYGMPIGADIASTAIVFEK